MIESTNPEIDVNELMERVRAEAARIRERPRRVRRVPALVPPALPPIAVLPPVPAVQIPQPINPKKERLDQLLENARSKTRVSSIIPKFLRGLFRKQGAYNTSVLESLGVLAQSSVELNKRVREIALCLERFNGWLLALNQHREADATWMTAATPAISMIAAQENELRRLEAELGAQIDANGVKTTQALEQVNLVHSATTDLQQQVALAHTTADDLQQQIALTHTTADDLQQQIAATGVKTTQALEQVNLVHSATTDLQQQVALAHTTADDLQLQMDRAGEHLRNLQAQADATGSHLGQLEAHWDAQFKQGNRDAQIDHALAHLKDLQGQADRLGVHINNLQGFVDQQTAKADTVQHSLEQLSERQANDAIFVKGELSEQQSLIQQVLGTDQRGKGPAGKRATVDDARDKRHARALDSFYLSFENRFRGSRAEIKKRVQFYLPFLASAHAGEKGRPILDLGCGRGEWLELLRENKLDARGVDLNSAMIAQCKERDLEVIHRDAIDYMRSLRANSQGGVTGFHIIEHLPFETLMDFFREARRILKPGGVAIFESPNCKNLVVGAANFNIDPTHRNPVFPETAEFMLQSHGFERIQIEYLTPVADVKFDARTKELAIVKDLLYGPQDFGIIAYKPAAR
jgi:O-antigen chain-terminating methyltransferase